MYILVGIIKRPHGLKGEVYVYPHTDDPEKRFSPKSVLTICSEGNHCTKGNNSTYEKTTRYNVKNAPEMLTQETHKKNVAQQDNASVIMSMQKKAVNNKETLIVKKSRLHSGKLLVTFTDIKDRTDAEKYYDTSLCVEQNEPVVLDEDEFFIYDLIDCSIFSLAGDRLGKVIAIDYGKQQSRLVVKCDNGNKRYIPFVASIVPEVDIKNKKVVVVTETGLFI